MTRRLCTKISRYLTSLAVVPLALACATTSGPGVTWEDRGGEASRANSADSTAAQSHGTKVSPADVAASVRSATECLQLAEANDKQSARTGWALLNACATRSDFTDLAAVLREPWLDRVKKSTATPRLLARVVAHRGGRVASDLERIQRKGIALKSIDQALAGKAAQAEQVLTRGDIREMNRTAGGWLLVVEETGYLSDVAVPAEPDEDEVDEVAEAAEAPGDGSGDDEVEQDESGVPEDELTLRKTGKRLLVKAAKLDPGVHEGPGWVLLLRFGGKQPCSDASDDGPRACVAAELEELIKIEDETP
ncbi:MAG: hypothetical protein ABIJ09_01805 [Pseudomonadota bacterium]